MEWTEVDVRVGRRWEREDGYAVVSVRETASGEWAVTYDRLTQAPEGEAYDRATEPDEEAALDRAKEYRNRA